MKTILKALVLIVLLLVVAGCGPRVTALGEWLNCYLGTGLAVWVLWGALCLPLLCLAVPLLLSLGRALVSGTRAGIGNMLIWGCIALLLYLGSDLIDKGVALNELTPYPVLGYMFWALIAFFVYWQVVAPILSFCRLTTLVSADPRARARAAMRCIHEWRTLARRERRDDVRRYDSLYDSLHNACSSRDTATLQQLLADYARQPDLLPRRSRELIFTYCQISALTVVVSRNKWLDGVAMLLLQLRLIVTLARLHGGKPSPVFNALCFGSVVLNSFVYVIINSLIYDNGALIATELVEDFAELLIDDPDVQYKAGNAAARNVPLLGMVAGVADAVAKPTLEAALAASNVYVVGHLFLRRLEGDATLPGFREVISMRRKGRLEIVRRVFAALNAKCSEKFGFTLPAGGMVAEAERSESPADERTDPRGGGFN